jgi:hypothetical protein
MKKTKLPSIIVLMILTLITVLFWISFTVYRVFTTESKPEIPEEVILKLDPNFDSKTLQMTKDRIHNE